MNDWIRLELAAVALMVYIALILMKVQDTRKASQSPGLKNLRFDLVRLILDCGILIVFLLSGLCPLWFGVFHETALGCCTGCIALISITLLVSVFVDWLPVRESYRQAGKRPPAFAVFMLRQFVRIFQIEFVLTVIWSIFLILEPTKTNLFVKLAVSALMLLALRMLLRWVRKPEGKPQKTEEPD